jgi:hypothetical protein
VLARSGQIGHLVWCPDDDGDMHGLVRSGIPRVLYLDKCCNLVLVFYVVSHFLVQGDASGSVEAIKAALSALPQVRPGPPWSACWLGVAQLHRCVPRCAAARFCWGSECSLQSGTSNHVVCDSATCSNQLASWARVCLLVSPQDAVMLRYLLAAPGEISAR